MAVGSSCFGMLLLGSGSTFGSKPSTNLRRRILSRHCRSFDRSRATEGQDSRNFRQPNAAIGFPLGLWRNHSPLFTIVDDHLTVLSHEVLHFVFPVQALDHGDVYASRSLHFAAADMPDRFGGQIQEPPKALLPLIEQLLTVNDDQRVDLAFRDQPRRNRGLPERRGSAQDTFVVGRNLRDGFLLERPKLTPELRFNRRARSEEH